MRDAHIIEVLDVPEDPTLQPRGLVAKDLQAAICIRRQNQFVKHKCLILRVLIIDLLALQHYMSLLPLHDPRNLRLQPNVGPVGLETLFPRGVHVVQVRKRKHGRDSGQERVR